jgi:predicted Zn-dependent protease
MRRSWAISVVVVSALLAGGLVAAVLPSPHPAAAQATGRIYFVPLGPGGPVPLKELADHFRQTYRLNTTVLPELALTDPRLQDNARFQLIAEEVLGYMARKHPKLSWEPGAVVIGVTAQDMYISGLSWNFAFGHRDGDRFAVLSTARMDPTWLADPANPQLLRKRLRKAATRMVGFLYYGYRETPDRRSVMFGPVLSIDDLDRLREDY